MDPAVHCFGLRLTPVATTHDASAHLSLGCLEIIDRSQIAVVFSVSLLSPHAQCKLLLILCVTFINSRQKEEKSAFKIMTSFVC